MTDYSPTAGRHLAIENRAIAALKPNPRNARKHAKRQIKAIAQSIKAFGFCNPVLIDDDGMILAGHGRFEASKLMGLDTIPTIRIGELSEAQKRAYVLADNQLAERAGWDRKMLAIELGELSVMLPKLSLSLELTGFELKGINTILTDAQREKALSSGDKLVLVPEKAVSRAGDLWLLGQHRLLCADGRDEAAVRQLVDKDQVDMVFTTPPFVAAIEAGSSLPHPANRSR